MTNNATEGLTMIKQATDLFDAITAGPLWLMVAAVAFCLSFFLTWLRAFPNAAVAPTVAEAIASGGVAHVAGARVVRTFVDDRATYGSLFGELAPRTTADPGGKSPVGAERSGRPRARRPGGRCWN